MSYSVFSLTPQLKNELVNQCVIVRQKAYAPYSKFLVGCAILGENNKIYLGCNMENLSYGLTICGERSAACQMVTDGCTRIKAVAVSTSIGASPCGACRQVLTEFVGKNEDFQVILYNTNEQKIVSETTIRALLPSDCDIKDHLHEISKQQP